jgi:hypothetical protein
MFDRGVAGTVEEDVVGAELEVEVEVEVEEGVMVEEGADPSIQDASPDSPTVLRILPP